VRPALILAALVAFAWISKMILLNDIRGYRNRNPGNIRENERVDYDWEGEAVIDHDEDFEVFTDHRFGIRAMARILTNYARRGVTTVEEIITTWAPPRANGKFENDTAAYIRSVSQRSGLAPQETVTPQHYPALISAIIHHELGIQPYSQALIRQGIAMA